MAQGLQKPAAPATNTLLLYYGVLAGPLAWAGDEGLSYMLDQHACSTGHYYVLHVITILAILICVSGVLISLQQLSAAGGGSEEGGSVRDRAFFMARLGVAMSIGFTLVIIALAVPRWVLSPCD